MDGVFLIPHLLFPFPLSVESLNMNILPVLSLGLPAFKSLSQQSILASTRQSLGRKGRGTPKKH